MNIHHLKQTTLTRVSDDKAFVVVRGDRITHIKDLANCIESLSDNEFNHHVNTHKFHSDWSDWTRNVLHNEELARDMNLTINLRDKEHLVKTIRDHVAWLEHHH